jgi:exodeoxyribonuclease V alpha subunit
MKLQKFEFDNKKYKFKNKNIKSEWNFYESTSILVDSVTLAIKDRDIQLLDNIVLYGSKTKNQYGTTVWVQSQEIDTQNLEFNICVLSEIKGITEVKAKTIFEESGVQDISSLLEYLKENNIKGIGEKIINRITKKSEEVLENSLFSKLHLILNNVKYAKKISEKIKNLDDLYENCYQVLRTLKIGFQKIDDIAINKLNIALDDKNRLMYIVEYKFNQFNIKQANYLNLQEFKEYLVNEVKHLGTDIDTFLNQNQLIVVEDNKVYLKKIYEAETKTPSLLLNDFTLDIDKDEVDDLIEIAEIRNFKNPLKLSENQRMSIKSIFHASKCNILTGEAGTGKSTITKIMCDISSTKYQILLLAPTGKAAGRMAECTNRRAKTIHSFCYFLENKYSDSYTTYERFGIDGDFILFIDEFSMVDQYLFYRLLRNIDECDWLNLKGIVLIGDQYQLPSVGCGQVLVDMINSKCFNHVHLTETFRQLSDSNIIKNSKKVRNKQTIDIIKTQDFWVDGLSEQNIKKFFFHFKTKYNDNNLELYKNIQFITSTNKTKDIINDLFKKPNSENFKFNKGDKVINTENNKNIGIYNGDFGIVESINKKYAQIYFYDVDIRVELKLNELDNIQLGYACTVHKLQGSEYTTVVIILENNKAISNFRSFYTAITRGKSNVIILAKNTKDIFEVCSRDDDYKRKTTFVKRLKEVNSYDKVQSK